MEIENRGMLENSFRNGINLFLGSGFSVLAKDAVDHPLPIGTKLAEELITTFNLDTFKALNLSQLCTVIKSSNEQKLNDYLQRRFTVNKYDPLYKTFREDLR